VYGLGGRELHLDGIHEVIEGTTETFVGLRSVRCPV